MSRSRLFSEESCVCKQKKAVNGVLSVIVGFIGGPKASDESSTKGCGCRSKVRRVKERRRDKETEKGGDRGRKMERERKRKRGRAIKRERKNRKERQGTKEKRDRKRKVKDRKKKEIKKRKKERE